jgi:hypothetical protein
MIKIASSERIREKITNEDDNNKKNYNNYSKKVIIVLATLVGSIAAIDL